MRLIHTLSRILLIQIYLFFLNKNNYVSMFANKKIEMPIVLDELS